MYIDVVPNRNSPPAILLRESYRDGKKIKKRTLANLSNLPMNVIEGLKVLLRGGIAVDSPEALFTIVRSLPHGHVAAVLGTARNCGVADWLGKAPGMLGPLLVAMVVSRILSPAPKLATWRMLQGASANNSLGRVLGLSDIDKNLPYEAMDWLSRQQPAIEKAIAKKHLTDGVLVLYDLTSTWITGRHCPLASYGYSRDGRRGDPQIVFGLLCAADGCPIAVEVFPGNTSDSKTVANQVTKLKERFGLSHVVWVGDRGMLTSVQIEEVLRPCGMDWITALRAPEIAKLTEEHGLQFSMFEERNLVELTNCEAYPGERVVVCRNPFLAEERARKREALLKATEKDLDKIVVATRRLRNPLSGKAEIGIRVGRVINRHKMAKHFALEITDVGFTCRRKADAIAAEAARDGLYAVRTNVPENKLSTDNTVNAYKSLANVERAFRSMKTMGLHVRPIHHRTPERVRAHVFLCMLAYYVEWHMRQKLKPMLFDDEDLVAQRNNRISPVFPTEPSEGAMRKKSTARNENGQPIHSFRTLLEDLGTITYNIVAPVTAPQHTCVTITNPTPLQAQAFSFLGIDPKRVQ